MSELSVKEQYIRVAYLGVSFMIMFSSFNSLQNIVSKLYDEYNYTHLGQYTIISIYLTFGICTILTSYIIKKFGYKKVMFVSSLGYAIFQSTGFLIVLDTHVPRELVWIIVILGSILCGASASVLWVAQAAYTSRVASVDRKSQLFGLFWALMMSSQIIGNLITTFVLGTISNIAYFTILSILGFLSSIMFLFLPSVSKQQQQTNNKSLKQQIKSILEIMKNSTYRYLLVYFLFPGLTVAFYAGFLYKIITNSIKQSADQSTDNYNKQLSYKAGLVFIALGASQLFTGIMMNQFSERFCKFKLAIVGTLIVQMAGFASFIAFFIQNYPLCFICAFLWGSAENFLQTNTNALISIIFPGKVEAFSVYRIFFAIGCCSTLFLSIAMSSLPAYYFLTLILIFQMIATGCSFNLRELNPDQTSSLISDNEKDA